MLDILNAAIAFPTVIFTGLLICLLFFWGSVILAGLDPQALDPGDVDADIDADVDVDADVDAGDVDVGDADIGDVHVDAGDVHVDAGHVEAGDVGHTDVGDALSDADGGHHGPGGGKGILSALLGFMNVGTVPVSIVATATSFVAWILCMMLTLYTKPALEAYVPALVVGFGFLFAALAGGCLVGSLCTRPLRTVFKRQRKHGGRVFLEKFCTITTDHVNERFGEAELKVEHGAPLLLSVRCRGKNDLKKGRLAVIVGYSKKKNTYRVAEVPEETEKIVRATMNPKVELDSDLNVAKNVEPNTESES